MLLQFLFSGFQSSKHIFILLHTVLPCCGPQLGPPLYLDIAPHFVKLQSHRSALSYIQIQPRTSSSFGAIARPFLIFRYSPALCQALEPKLGPPLYLEIQPRPFSSIRTKARPSLIFGYSPALRQALEPNSALPYIWIQPRPFSSIIFEYSSALRQA